MTNHPYIGLHGRIRGYPHTGPDAGKYDVTGIVAAVCQGGSTAEDGGVAYCSVILLRDTPTDDGRVHAEGDIYHFTPDDPEEARQRLRTGRAGYPKDPPPPATGMRVWMPWNRRDLEAVGPGDSWHFFHVDPTTIDIITDFRTGEVLWKRTTGHGAS